MGHGLDVIIGDLNTIFRIPIEDKIARFNDFLNQYENYIRTKSYDKEENKQDFRFLQEHMKEEAKVIGHYDCVLFQFYNSLNFFGGGEIQRPREISEIMNLRKKIISLDDRYAKLSGEVGEKIVTCGTWANLLNEDIKEQTKLIGKKMDDLLKQACGSSSESVDE